MLALTTDFQVFGIFRQQVHPPVQFAHVLRRPDPTEYILHASAALVAGESNSRLVATLALTCALRSDISTLLRARNPQLL